MQIELVSLTVRGAYLEGLADCVEQGADAGESLCTRTYFIADRGMMLAALAAKLLHCCFHSACFRHMLAACNMQQRD